MSTITEEKKKSTLLVLNEEQELLKNAAREFLKEKAPVMALRQLRDENNPHGYDLNLWDEMAQNGWPGLLIPEQYGGIDFGHVGMGLLMEEMGRTLTASPLFSTSLVSTTALMEGGNDAQKEALLPAIAEGKMVMSLALEEGRHHRPLYIALEAKAEGDGFILNGGKTFVPDGHVADQIIVAVRTAGDANSREGITLLLVDMKAEGITVQRNHMVDSRNWASIEFKEVKVPASGLLGEKDRGFSVLEKILDVARIGLAAELLGIMQESFERTIAYLKERKQFGVPIGSFQGLQHRAADLYCHIEMCQSVVLKALVALEEGSDRIPLMASLAKAKTCETVKRVTNEAIQMFGGIGVTDDEEIGFFLKRARTAQQLYGDYNYHLDRFASLQGY